MKNSYLIIIFSVLVNCAFGQQKIIVHNSGNTMYAKEISAIDSIQLDNTYSKFKITGETSTLNIQKKFIDSLTFTTNTVNLDKIYIIYNGTENATIINPYATRGVTMTATAGTVVVTAASGIDNLEYNILGSTANGSLSMTTDKDVKLVLNNLTLTNPSGAVFSLSTTKTANIVLTAGTTNTLSDGSTSTKNGTITTNGPVVISNSGTLKLTGVVKHGINAASTITVQNGTIIVSSATTDGFHSEGFTMSGGSVNITSSSDGIDAGDGAVSISAGSITVASTSSGAKGITTGKGFFTMSGGTANLTLSGAASRGINARDVLFTGGSVIANVSGAAVLTASGSGFTTAYATAVKSDSLITVNGGTYNITITTASNGGKGFSSGKGIIITEGVFTINTAGTGAAYTKSTGVLDSYSSSCFTTDADLTITGGTFTLTVSGTAGKGLSADGNMTIGSAGGSPIVKITNTGAQILVSGTSGTATADYAGAKCIKSEGILTINNGSLTLSVNNQNGTCIQSDSTLFVKGGSIECKVDGNQSKGIQSAQDMALSGGTVTIIATGGVVLETSGSGAIPSYCAGIKSAAHLNLSGATVVVTGSGAGFKGISSNKNINMTAGNVNVTNTGIGTTYTLPTGVKDAYSPAALTADSTIVVTGGTLTTNCSGAGGKGLTSDKGITIGNATSSPTLSITTSGARFLVSGTDYCHPKAVVSAGAVAIVNGNNTINSKDDGIHSDISVTISGGNTIVNATSTTQGMGEGIEAPTITFSGGVTNITSSNDGINATYGTVSGGTEQNDGSNLYITGGIVIVAGSDAIDSNGNITITGGTTIVCGPTSSPEEGIDFNGTFNVNGGLLISAGSNANMTKAMNSTSTQRCMYLKSSAQLPAASLLHIENGTGTEVVTFAPKNAVYYFHVSSSTVAASTSYKVYFGGTYTGGSFVGNSTGWGLYTGGSYSTTGATLKSTFTSSATSTVNTVTF
ncbi:MAG: carbohydrate-binding domain-containing protein [Saprospiraceae bacterium]|nr:carbohydrate-binding domain-containing protein [Saprospiraceae bacterium]